MFRLPFLLVPVVLAGCTALRIEKPARMVKGFSFEIPQSWVNAGPGGSGAVVSGWLKQFNDPEMESLVDEALRHNQDLKVAAARLRQAREGTIIARADRLPSLVGAGSGSRSGSRFRHDDGGLSGWEHDTDYGLSLNASWELDLWGRLRDLEEASWHDYVSAQADFRGAYLSLAANTAKSWCNLITARQLVSSAEETLEMFRKDLAMKKGDYVEGVGDSALEVRFGENNVASAERSLLDRRLDLGEAARSLEVLIGRYPEASLEARDTLPPLPGPVPAGLPSELLLRRPDVVAATAELLASASLADAARKDLLPSISLNGRGSTSSNQLADLIADPQSVAWNAASSVTQTLFRGGAPTAQARRALQQNEVAINLYAATVLQAFREVESALAVDRSLAAQQEFSQVEYDVAVAAQSQAEADFLEGLVTPLELLESQRRVIVARNARISLRNDRLQNRIDLHLALGGDFQTLPPDPPGSAD